MQGHCSCAQPAAPLLRALFAATLCAIGLIPPCCTASAGGNCIGHDARCNGAAKLPCTRLQMEGCVWTSSSGGASPAGYMCTTGVDICGRSCDIKGKRVHATLDAIAAACNASYAHNVAGCVGFNSNGYLKRCVRPSCGAMMKDNAKVTSCVRVGTPSTQPVPPGCDSPSPVPPHPSPHPPPPPSPHPPHPQPPSPPSPPPQPAPAFNCSITAERPDCNCSGVHPPYAVPPAPMMPALQEDYHFPVSEPQETASLVHPVLLATAQGTSATLHNPATNQTVTLVVGGAGTAWGWELSHVGVAPPHAVVEYRFEQWAQLAYLDLDHSEQPWQQHALRERPRAGKTTVIRKPVGHLFGIKQPVYTFKDPEYNCKQDTDPTDWLARLAVSMSSPTPVPGEPAETAESILNMPQHMQGTRKTWHADAAAQGERVDGAAVQGGRVGISTEPNIQADAAVQDGRVGVGTEPTIQAAASVMAPNPDSGLFGNPEELNKFMLTDEGVVLSMPFRPKKDPRPAVQSVMWDVSSYLPVQCQPHKGATPTFWNAITGMAGRYLRVVNQARHITAAAPCAPVLPLSQRKIHTRGNIWSFTVG